MPLIDVSELLTDPDFAGPLTIQRRTDTIDSHGRTSSSVTTISPAPYGVILPVDTAIGGNALERGDDAQYRGSAIEVITQFRLQGPAPGMQPDIVIYEGNPFVVTIVNSLSKYGAGFLRVECSSMNAVDNPAT